MDDVIHTHISGNMSGYEAFARTLLRKALAEGSQSAFDAILNRWILNPGFPRDGAGVDALFARGYARIEQAAFLSSGLSARDLITKCDMDLHSMNRQ